MCKCLFVLFLLLVYYVAVVLKAKCNRYITASYSYLNVFKLIRKGSIFNCQLIDYPIFSILKV